MFELCFVLNYIIFFIDYLGISYHAPRSHSLPSILCTLVTTRPTPSQKKKEEQEEKKEEEEETRPIYVAYILTRGGLQVPGPGKGK